MKCQHGNTVKVVVKPVYEGISWDGGVRFTDCNGKYTPFTDWVCDPEIEPPATVEAYAAIHRYLPVIGCPKCKAIKIG